MAVIRFVLFDIQLYPIFVPAVLEYNHVQELTDQSCKKKTPGAMDVVIRMVYTPNCMVYERSHAILIFAYMIEYIRVKK